MATVVRLSMAKMAGLILVAFLALGLFIHVSAVSTIQADISHKKAEHWERDRGTRGQRWIEPNLKGNNSNVCGCKTAWVGHELMLKLLE